MRDLQRGTLVLIPYGAARTQVAIIDKPHATRRGVVMVRTFKETSNSWSARTRAVEVSAVAELPEEDPRAVKAREAHAEPSDCECDDPDCSLPLGRCCVCGTPCTAGYGTELCAGCIPKVAQLYEAERRTDPHLDGPGWFIANGFEIQRCDSRGRFADDEEAAAHVLAQVAPPVSSPPAIARTPEQHLADIREAIAAALPSTEGLQADDAVAALIDRNTQLRFTQREDDRPPLAPLSSSDVGLVLQALREKASGDRAAASELEDHATRLKDQLERQAEHALQLADIIEDAAGVATVTVFRR